MRKHCHVTMLSAVLLLLFCLQVFSSVRAQTQCPGSSITVSDEATGQHWCIDCRTCPPGQGLSVNCGAVISPQTPVSCIPCVLGETYSSATDAGSCKDCQNCERYRETTKACTLTSKAECGNCRPGAYSNGLLPMCVPCSPCCNDGNDRVIPGCQVPGVPANMQCSYARSEKCRKVAARMATEARISRTSSTPKITSSVVRPSTTYPTAMEVTISVNRSDENQETQYRDEQVVNANTAKPSRRAVIAGGIIGGLFAAAIIIIFLVCFFKNRSRQAREKRIELVPDNVDMESEKRPEQVQGEDGGGETEKLKPLTVLLEEKIPVPVQETGDSPLPLGVQDSQPPGSLNNKDLGKTSFHEEPRPGPSHECHRHTKSAAPKKTMTDTMVTVHVTHKTEPDTAV